MDPHYLNPHLRRTEPWKVVPNRDFLEASLKVTSNAFRTMPSPGKSIHVEVTNVYPLDLGWRIETTIGEFDLLPGEYVWVIYDEG
jgi:hypothetical protein